MYTAKANAVPLSVAVGIEQIPDTSEAFLNVALVAAISDLCGSNCVSRDRDRGLQGITAIFARRQGLLTAIVSSHGDARPQPSLGETNVPAYFKEKGRRISRVNISETGTEPRISVSPFANFALLDANDLEVGPMAGDKVIADSFPHTPRNEPKPGGGQKQSAREASGPPLWRIPIALIVGLGSNGVMFLGLNLNDERRVWRAALCSLATSMFLGGIGLMLTLGIPGTWGWWV
jgi:hypothetical protein